MEYIEFSKYKLIKDSSTLAKHYRDDEGNEFFIEPGFYYQLIGFKDKRPESYQTLLEGIYKCIKENHKVIFTINFESPFFEKEGFIYKEIEDISDELRIFFEDKSRGSDYGD